MNKSTFTLLGAFLILALDAYTQCPPTNQRGYHVVQRGENLYRISLKYNVKMDDLYVWNSMKEGEVLLLCKKIRVAPPQDLVNEGERALNAETVFRKNQTVVRQDGPYHIVQNGENIKNIAELYGYTESYFRSFNSLRSSESVAVGFPLLSTDCECRYKNYGQAANHYSGYTSQEVTPNYSESYLTENTQPEAEDSELLPDITGKKGRGYRLSSVASLVKIFDEKPEANLSQSTRPESGKEAIEYMSADERKMLDEINMLRANPSGYIPYIEDYIRDMQEFGELGNSIETAKELIGHLRNTPELNPLSPMECLYRVAQKHANDQKPTGDINHQGTDGSWPWDRITNSCEGIQDGNENIVAGPEDVRKLVIILLVDDGIPSRGHRGNLLNPDWKYVSCLEIGNVGAMPNYWLQMFAR